MDIKKIVFGIFVFASFSACNDIVITRKNDENDLKKIDSLATMFYKSVKKRSIDSLSSILDKSIIKREDAEKIILKMKVEYGNIRAVEPVSVSSDVQVKNNKLSRFNANVISIAIYDYGKFEETLVLHLVNDTIKVCGYHYKVIQ